MRLGWLMGPVGTLAGVVMLVGCSGGSVAPPPTYDGSVPDVVVAPPRKLEVVSDPQISLLFGELAQFDVRLTEADGTPIEGAVVSLALEGSANDSTLATLQLTTNADGRASGLVTAGSTKSVFQIRVTADRAAPVFIGVSVSDAGFGSIDATLDDRVDNRRVERRVAVVFVDATCADPGIQSRASSLPSRTLGASTTSFQFDLLPADTSYAVAVRLEGPDGDLLGWGCTDTVVADGMAVEVTVVTESLPLVPDGEYDAALVIDATMAADQAGLALRSDATAVIGSHGGEAALLLDAIADGLDPTLASMFDLLRTSLPLETELETALADAGVGPAAAVSMATLDVQTTLTSVTVRGPLIVDPAAPTPIDWRLDAIAAGPDATMTTLSLAAGDLTPNAAASLQLSLLVDQDAVALSALDVTLPLGSLARAALEKAAVAHGGSTTADLVQSGLGCPTFVSFVTGEVNLVGVCDAACAQTACEAAARELADALVAAADGLDDPQAQVRFAPDTPVQGALEDTTGDLRVDHVSVPGLEGVWTSAGGTAGIPVSAALDADRTGDLP